MANNYVLSSTQLNVPRYKLARAKEIVERVTAEIEAEEDYCGCFAEFTDEGIWFHHDESITVEHVEAIAVAVIEELEIDDPFFFSWAYICDKPRLDEFGGGAMVIKRGYKPFAVDALSYVSSVMNAHENGTVVAQLMVRNDKEQEEEQNSAG